MLDYVIRNATVIDGTGAPGFVADVGVASGRIVALGSIDEQGAQEIDATGLMVMPGVIDPHTHYDAQLFWDPSASPSNGVTTIIGGNCGFTLAPVAPEDAGYISRMMAKVEGMPLIALEEGVPWNWESFGEYLDRLEGKLGVNAGFLVGHCALRRKVMGDDRHAEVATDEEIEAMRSLLAESIAAGGLGFSSSQSRTHSDGEGRPINSKFADRREMLAFCEENAQYEWRDVASIAAELGKSDFDTLLDIVIADDLRTVLWPKATDTDDATWQARVKVWRDPRVMIGGSDAGAHLDRMCGTNYPTSFLGDCLHGRKLIPVEEAVRMMTSDPAELFGLTDRGVVREGAHADLVIFDPTTIASEPARLVEDLPGGSPRLFAASIGVVRVLVGGTEIIVDGTPTGALPGSVIRSGADTTSVTTA